VLGHAPLAFVRRELVHPLEQLAIGLDLETRNHFTKCFDQLSLRILGQQPARIDQTAYLTAARIDDQAEEFRHDDEFVPVHTRSIWLYIDTLK